MSCMDKQILQALRGQWTGSTKEQGFKMEFKMYYNNVLQQKVHFFAKKVRNFTDRIIFRR